MTKKEKFKNWCKENKELIIGGSLLIVGCAGAAFGLSKIFKPDDVDPYVIDLNDCGILGKVLDCESKSGAEYYSFFEGYKIADLGKFGEDMLKDASDGISLDSGINGVLVMVEKLEKTE